MIRTRISISLAMLGVVVLAGTATAQDDGNDHTCDKATKIVSRGKPQKKEQWAYGVLATCSGGATTLASAWNSAPADTDAFHSLAAASYSIGDHAIITAVLGLLVNANAPQQLRRTAFNVALAQFNPSFTVLGDSWTNPATAGLGRQSDYHQVSSDQPVTAADRQAVVNALSSLGTSDPDPVMKQVAARLAIQLARYL